MSYLEILSVPLPDPITGLPSFIEINGVEIQIGDLPLKLNDGDVIRLGVFGVDDSIAVNDSVYTNGATLTISNEDIILGSIRPVPPEPIPILNPYITIMYSEDVAKPKLYINGKLATINGRSKGVINGTEWDNT